MAAPVNLLIEEGEQVAVVGDNAAGKSRLVEMLTGRCRLRGNALQGGSADGPTSDVRYITFHDSYGDSDNTYFLQQRWNQTEIDESTPRVGELL